MNPVYQRNVEDLRQLASMFWPSELSKQEAELSVIPKLIETQDQFIAILSVSVSNLNGLFQIIESSSLPANLFLKHLLVLADFGGEMIQRLNSQFDSIFPSKRLDYLWDTKSYSYSFLVLPVSGQLNNNKLGITGKKILEDQPLSQLHKDVIALILFGSNSTNEKASEILVKCEIGNYIGRTDKLQQFIKQRYIWVSRITAGSQSNSLGQITQTFVKEYLENHLNLPNVNIKANGQIPGISHTEDNNPTTFDIVLSQENKYVAIEVSFQVTTNSVIERKAGQAKSRFEQIEALGYKIGYVLDGAGNFQRENALRIICSYSHCTVAFSRDELDVFCDFLKEYFVDR
ncbi:restriction endonuclease [Nodularia spumigena CS-584]|nr:restriction endonuclease [Nodularia spumigena]MDB9381979.1 restriction endonuclease [Nodularia spumigena CS-584]